MTLIDLLLFPAFAILGGLSDRLRGKIGSLGSIVYSVVLSFAVLGLYPDHLWMLLVYIVAFFLGELSGWGYPLGSALRGYRDPRIDDHRGKEPHGWQVGKLKKDNYLALFVRGAWWGTPVLVASMFMGQVAWHVPLVMGVTMLASAVMVAKYVRVKIGHTEDPMEYSQMGLPIAEKVRGAMTASILYIIGFML